MFSCFLRKRRIVDYLIGHFVSGKRAHRTLITFERFGIAGDRLGRVVVGKILFVGFLVEASSFESRDLFAVFSVDVEQTLPSWAQINGHGGEPSHHQGLQNKGQNGEAQNDFDVIDCCRCELQNLDGNADPCPEENTHDDDQQGK